MGLGGYGREMGRDGDPRWLSQLRIDATQRPRTQFRSIRWAHLQLLLRDFDALWEAATPETRARVEATRPDPDDVRYVN